MLAAVLPLVHNHVAVHDVLEPGRGGDYSVLDRVLQLDPEPGDLRVLQSRVPRGVQEHAGVRVLQLLPAQAVGPGRPGRAESVAAVRRPHQERLLGDVPQVRGQAEEFGVRVESLSERA